MLVNGKWVADWQPVQKADDKGRFVRQTSSFRNWITPDGAPGPTGEGGFKGLGGNYGRRGLLLFGRTGIGADVRLTRLDSGASVAASLDLSVLPPSPELGEAMQRVLSGRGGDEARIRFAALWQERVRSLLLDFFVHPALVRFAD